MAAGVERRGVTLAVWGCSAGLQRPHQSPGLPNLLLVSPVRRPLFACVVACAFSRTRYCSDRPVWLAPVRGLVRRHDGSVMWLRCSGSRVRWRLVGVLPINRNSNSNSELKSITDFGATHRLAGTVVLLLTVLACYARSGQLSQSLSDIGCEPAASSRDAVRPCFQRPPTAEP